MTLDQFRQACGLSSQTAERWYEPLTLAMNLYGIDTPVRIAAFLAQTGHETLSFSLTRELWGPTPAQKNYEPPAAKASRLGNTDAGDGFRFRGRGLIQITGRCNYQTCGKALGIDLLAEPERLESDEWAARSAAWWWNEHGCNELADQGDFTALTRRINGGTNGLEDRLRRWEQAKRVLA
jgi:putative chitinase